MLYVKVNFNVQCSLRKPWNNHLDVRRVTVTTLSKHKCYDKNLTTAEVINGSHGSYKVGYRYVMFSSDT